MPEHVVVDGSNIATEGRQMPSLRQLKEAVAAFVEERPDSLITIVVDATFGHRIDPSELAEFDADVSNNRIVAPPAGAVGRGDAFVLSIAKKVKATILTNDSYQEFHHEAPWLFEEGRLIGGKPVPHIGWVFVNRIPVRGPKSRKATADAKRKRRSDLTSDTGSDSGTVRVGSADASQPMPVPKAPPPGPARKASKKTKATVQVDAATKASTKASTVASTKADDAHKPAAAPRMEAAHVNDLMAFLSFVERHPVGSSVQAVVDHYASHGAYVKVGEVLCYLPLRLMASPAPRSAREFVKLGESLELVVQALLPARRSIDLAVPAMAGATVAEDAPAKQTATKKTPAKKAVAAKKTVAKTTATTKVAEPAKKVPAKQAPAKKAAEPAKDAPGKKVAAKKAPAKKAPVKKGSA